MRLLFMRSTALQLAASLQDSEIFRMLLNGGADVKANAGRGDKTVLQAATYADNIELVQFLLQNLYTCQRTSRF